MGQTTTPTSTHPSRPGKPGRALARRGLTGFQLKLIACITMLIDHIGLAVVQTGILALPSITSSPSLYSQWYGIGQALRLIGRIAFPVYCFLLVEGFLHTRSVKKYATRLAVFALFSEVPFDLMCYGKAFDAGTQNVYFTLLIGLLAMAAAKWCEDSEKPAWQQAAVYAGGALLAWVLKTDYDFKGIVLITALYVFRDSRRNQCVGEAVATCYEVTGPLAAIPIWLYNGERGCKKGKYFFYVFYPAHLALLAGLRAAMMAVCG